MINLPLKVKGFMLNKIEELIKIYFAAKNIFLDTYSLEVSQRPDLGDFQSNVAFNAAKILKRSPKEVAIDLINFLKVELPSINFEFAAPGFINITLDSVSLLNLSQTNLIVPKLKLNVLVDYGSPNVAKGMHVGHLRSSLIGASLVNIYKEAGSQVTGDNHLGDWGTPLGIVINKIKQSPNFKWTLEEIESLYISGAKQYKEDESFKEEVKKTTNLLQKGSKEEKALWQKVIDTTVSSLKKDYQELGITFDLWLGESSFEPLISPMLEELKQNNLVTTSDGALILPLENYPPVMLEKEGGGFLYHTTDLACLKERSKTYDKILYVVDKRQNLHFSQIFSAAKKVNYIKDLNQVEHVAFGTINGNDGKPFKTRDGGVLKLKDLILLMKESAAKKLEALGVTYAQEEKDIITALVGIGALKFAELKHNRLSDYVFDLDKFTSLEGYTGPYVMYAAVRAKSILNKEENLNFSPNANHEFTPSERILILTLAQFPYYFKQALNKNEPNHLCQYSFNLANSFNNFYHHNSVLKEEDLVKKQHYLWLTNQSFKTLEKALTLLGIILPEKM